MERILEPELMDDREQAIAYDAADFSASHGRRVTLFRERCPFPTVAGPVLDLGCGSGDILERFAVAYPQANWVGVDGSQPMLDLARARFERAGLQGRVELVRALIPSPAIPKQDSRVIMSHSLLHHLHYPEALWETIRQHATPDTWVFVADLRRPDSAAVAAEIVETRSGNEPEILKRDFYNSLCAAFTPAEVTEQFRAAGLTGLTIEPEGDIHLLIHGRVA